MDLLTRKHLEERICEEVQTMLTEGDRTYLQGLSRAALLEAMENELRFLGLYAHSDTETPTIIHVLLEQHLDLWRMRYLSQQDSSISSAQPPTPAISAEISSPWVQNIISTASSFQIAQAPRYSALLSMQGNPLTA